jgi:hypothetical protein
VETISAAVSRRSDIAEVALRLKLKYLVDTTGDFSK